MPIYEYECGVCQCRFEKRQGFEEKIEVTCPECDGEARKIFHPAHIIFKGSGFYVTDSRKSAGSASPKSAPSTPSTPDTSSTPDTPSTPGTSSTPSTPSAPSTSSTPKDKGTGK